VASSETVADLMSRTVRTVSSDESLTSALNQMISYDIGSVIVIEHGRPFGIITERDIVRQIGKAGGSVLGRRVGELASRPLVSIGPEVQIWEAFAIMLKNRIRRLPVVSGETLKGIVTERDLLKWVVKVTYEPNIPEEIKRLLTQNP
jgi:CBS domain-containing protein